MRKRRRGRAALLLLILLLLSAGAAGYLAYRSLVTELAVSTVHDVIVQSVNDAMRDCMRDGGGQGLVEVRTDDAGAVTAVTTDVEAVNTLAAEILDRVVDATAENNLPIRVPVGNVLGVPVLSVPVGVKMLSSSHADFRSELIAAGINQSRHRIVLELTVDASLFMPWRVVGTSAEAEILVSETVIVGDVPQSYLNWENK